MIRPASAGDAHAIAELVVRSWRWAYVDILDAQMLHELDVDDRETEWAALIEDGDADVVVFALDGFISGAAAVVPVVDAPATAELVAIYVDPRAQGAGVGAELLARATSLMRGRGFSSAVLWTFAENGHAIGFYERRGWVLDAGGTAPPRCDGADSVRYRLEL